MAERSINVQKLARYLRAQIPGFAGLDEITKFADGQSNPTYLLKTPNGSLVLRRKPGGVLLKSAHAIDREFRVIEALQNTNVPVPRAIHLCLDEGILGTAFYIMSHVDGRTFWNPALPELTAQQRAGCYDQMNAALANLHSVDVQACGLTNFGKSGNYYDRQFIRWLGQYRATQTEHLAPMEAIIDWLSANMVPDDGRVALVHGDFRLDNMIFSPDGQTLRALLDWELSTLGHPFADLAYQCALWGMPPDSALRGLAGVDRTALGLPDEARYVADYCARMGLSGIANWPFYLVFSLFRMAAIVQGVKKRALDGTASSARAFEVGALTAPLATHALDILKRDKA